MSVGQSDSRCSDSSSRRCAGGSSPSSQTPRRGRRAASCRSWNSCRRNLLIDRVLTRARSRLPALLTTSNLESTTVRIKGVLGEVHLTGYFQSYPAVGKYFLGENISFFYKYLLHVIFDDFLVCDPQPRHLPQYLMSLKVLQTIDFQIRLPQTFDRLGNILHPTEQIFLEKVPKLW